VPEMPDSISIETLAALAQRVREACRAGKVVPRAELWQENDAPPWEKAGIQDIALIHHGEREYFYSELLMTHSYAEMAARARNTNACLVIAETVRDDSRIYARPTPIAIFMDAPFQIPQDSLSQALEDMCGDPRYSDVRSVWASDDSRFLFSSIYLHPAQAESLVEWAAVGRLQNP
jgi:hypothetical protein